MNPAPELSPERDLRAELADANEICRSAGDTAGRAVIIADIANKGVWRGATAEGR